MNSDLELKRSFSMTTKEKYIPIKRSRGKYKKYRLRTVEESKRRLEEEERRLEEEERYWQNFYANKEIKETEFIKEYKRKKEESKFNRRFIVGSRDRIIKRTNDIFEELMSVVWQYGSPMMCYNMSGW